MCDSRCSNNGKEKIWRGGETVLCNGRAELQWNCCKFDWERLDGVGLDGDLVRLGGRVISGWDEVKSILLFQKKTSLQAISVTVRCCHI